MTWWVDAHQHFWRYSAQERDRIHADRTALRREFLPSQLISEMIRSGVDATIAVQARQTVAETEWLLKLAGEHPFVAGVVGWAPLSRPDFPADLERLIASPKLRGLRHILQDEPDDNYMLGDAFNRSVTLLKNHDLVYEIPICEHHLPNAVQFVDRHPNQKFVVDQLAMPRILAKESSPFSRHIRELARRPQVSCKLSGLVTEANWNHWTVDDLRPYVETTLEVFGPRRILAGSGWPGCSLATGYQRWWQTLLTVLSGLSDSERNAVLGGNAIEIYNLKGLEL